ncbi:MAG: hypothetical protein K9L02_07525 [Acholeplasmataceae bacterium]|nr:hypothetical protein [Acholeplasmataceae bacterium]
MSNSKKVSFNKVRGYIYVCSEPFLIETKNGIFAIDPYIKENSDEESFEKKFLVGIQVKEMEKNDNDELQIVTLKRSSQKRFIFHTDILREIVNIESGIMERLLKRTDDEIFLESFDFVYDDSKTYLKIGNFNNRLSEYLESFDYLEIEENLIFAAEQKTKIKLLKSFKEELLHSFSINEHDIERVLKKYQGFLPLLIPGINGVAKFQYIVDTDDFATNIIDIQVDNNHDFPNLIELKKEDVQLFKLSEYRNNTCKLTSEFSNAIQQTNIQRNMVAASESDPNRTLVKSFLLIGNLKKEIELHRIEPKIIQMNYNVVKYNNKDCDILTYDKLIERIDLLLSENISST